MAHGERATEPRETGVGARLTPFLLAAIVAFGALLRLWRLGATPLNFDESFTAMVGRLPLGTVFGFLRAHDSHPPLDYLIQLPLARAGVSPFVFRLPSVACSIAALGLFAWWMRDRGRVGVLATGAMAVCAFQLNYAREARMYGPMALIGVAVAMTAESWLRSPRRRDPYLIGGLVLVGLMTHVSMLLAVVGLLAIAGTRGDRDAWRWRAGIGAGTAAWAVLWGPSFLVQSGGGHSSWIPHTTVSRFVDTIGQLVTFRSGLAVIVFAGVVVGLVIAHRRDATLATVLLCCSAIPVALAGLIGLRAPVLLDRTLTVAAWGPLLALAFVVDLLARRARIAGVVAVVLAFTVMLPTAMKTVNVTGGPTVALRELERVARPGDVIAVQPASKGVELDWTLGVRSDDGPTRSVQLAGFTQTSAIALTGRPPTGRIWVMQFRARALGIGHYRRCARTWRDGPNRLVCIERVGPHLRTGPAPTILTLYELPPKPVDGIRRG
jgi:hypothetical protein